MLVTTPVGDRSELKVVLHLWGAFSVADAKGSDLTPTLSKSQALLALLATARDGVRLRSWLKAHLWSDRSDAQAAGSLRQALAALRRALGPSAVIVNADRQRISLDLSAIEIAAPSANEEFLAGLDVRDNAFDDWLRLERAHRADLARLFEPEAGPEPRPEPVIAPVVSAPHVSRPRHTAPIVTLLDDGNGAPEIEPFRTYLVDTVARTLRESFAVRTFCGPRQSRGDDSDLVIRLTVSQVAQDEIFLSARCQHGRSEELLWSGNRRLSLTGSLPFESVDALSWANEIVSAVAEFLRAPMYGSQDAMTATQLGLASLRELFSMQPLRVEQADQMLAQAYAIDPRAIYLGWRAQLRGIQSVERHNEDTDALREEGLDFARQALASDPSNSSVLATTANARHILDGDMFACDHLSRQSVTENPSNPLGWWARSLCLIYSNRTQEAHQASKRAHELSRGSPFRFWWDMQLAITACSVKRIDSAILAAERCAVTAPSFRPPMRYLAGLYAAKGHTERALHWAKMLAEHESDFHPDRLLSDPTYPTSLLRDQELLTVEELAPLRERFDDR